MPRPPSPKRVRRDDDFSDDDLLSDPTVLERTLFIFNPSINFYQLYRSESNNNAFHKHTASASIIRAITTATSSATCVQCCQCLTRCEFIGCNEYSGTDNLAGSTCACVYFMIFVCR